LFGFLLFTIQFFFFASDFDADCFFGLKNEHIAVVVANKYLAIKLAMALENRRTNDPLPGSSQPVVMERWFPKTGDDVAAIRDVDLQKVLGCYKNITDYSITTNDEAIITNSVMKEILDKNGYSVM
jgi:hypothetical protein